MLRFVYNFDYSHIGVGASAGEYRSISPDLLNNGRKDSIFSPFDRFVFILVLVLEYSQGLDMAKTRSPQWFLESQRQQLREFPMRQLCIRQRWIPKRAILTKQCFF